MTETQTALVTGASSGIGLAITRRLLQQGYRVVGISRHANASTINDPNFVPLALDLCQLEPVDKAIRGLLKEYQFNCLIHAAGAGLFGSIEQFSVKQIDQSIRLNLTSGMLLSRALVPAFRRQSKGRFIFIGSESALIAGKKGALYSAAKFGLRGFCQALREDCGKDGIQVSLINPGMVETPFFDQLNFRPGPNNENSIDSDDLAKLVMHILESSPDIVFDEINLSPRVKSIDFSAAAATDKIR